MGLESEYTTPRSAAPAAGSPRKEPAAQYQRTGPGIKTGGPRISFIDKVKTWFESTLTNTGDFIE
jgi:hypothetical protein